MERLDVITYWRKFFTDLLVGTFKSLFLFGAAGFVLGALGALIINFYIIEPLEYRAWLDWLMTILAACWLLALGVFHGIISSIISVASKKLSEVVMGLHDLLDILVFEVVSKYTDFNKSIPKKELDKKFDEIGGKFLDDLKLKKGIFYFLVRIIFMTIVKALKFIFLDDVLEELKKKDSEHISRTDMESAVRRVGTEMAVSTISDYLILLHIFNVIFMAITFGLPFAVFRWLGN